MVAVTGASGHVGANLVRGLLAAGGRVRALVRRNSDGIDGLPVEIVRADVLDRESLVRAFARVGCVYHLAAKVSAGWERAAVVNAVNVTGTENVVAACLAARVPRLVHFSSIQALAAVRGMVDESSPLVEARAGRAVYDHTKALAERHVLAACTRGLDAVILNPTAVIGPFDFQPSPLGETLLALARGRLPGLVGSSTCDFVDVRDVVAAALVAQRQGRSGQRYVLSGTRLSLVELAQRWARVTGRSSPRLVVPMTLARMVAPVASTWARLRGRRPLFTGESLRVLRTQRPASRAVAEVQLGYRPRPLDETLRDTHAWWKEQGRL
jgi:dihydroflavonol-4-reductase